MEHSVNGCTKITQKYIHVAAIKPQQLLSQTVKCLER